MSKAPTKQDREEMEAYCRVVTLNQLRNVLDKERKANRRVYAAIAERVLAEREAREEASR